MSGRALVYRHTPGGPHARPALYLHGLGGSSTNWTDLAGLLADVLDGDAVDLPGYGASDPPAGGDYRLPAQATSVVALLTERRRGPVHLIANSLGGAVAVVVAARRPDLVRTLTLVSPAMPDLRPHNRVRALLSACAIPGVQPLAERRLLGLSPEERVRQVIGTVFGDPSRVPAHRIAEAVVEGERRAALPWSDDAFVRSLRGLLTAYLSPGDRSLWSQARQVRAPTLIVWGMKDVLVPMHVARRTTTQIPGARLLLLPGVGHVAQLEAPAEVATAIRELLGSSRAGSC